MKDKISNEDFASIESIFRNRDMAPYEDAIIRSCNKSIENKRRERIARKEKIRKDELKKKIISIVLSGLIVVGAGTLYKIGFDVVDKLSDDMLTIVDKIDKQQEMEKVSKKIGSLVFEKDEDFIEKFDTTEVSILAQCTKRTSDNSGYMYLHQKIADKIKELPEELQEYALCATLLSMNSDKDVKFDGVKTNADYLIECLNIEDAKTLDEYLSHVNKDGEPDFKEFLNSNYEQTDFIKAVVNSELEEMNRGVSSGRN